jgi:hypothetical protein
MSMERVLLSLDELVDDWTLLDDERELVAGKRGATKLERAGRCSPVKVGGA